jgi:predicted dehydrogenase
MPARKRLLLVGAGRWGTVFLRNLLGHSRARVGGIVTSREAPALEENTAVYPDFAKAMNAPWDGVILATPPETHAAQLEICLRKRIPVLVEKPLTVSLAEAEKLGALAQETGSPVLVDHILLFHPGYEWLKKNVNPGEITRIASVGRSLGPYRAGYSPLWDYGAHDLSLALDLLGGEITGVEGEARELGTVEGGQAGSYTFRLSFSGGQKAEFSVSNRGPDKARSLAVETREGKFLLDDQPTIRLTRATLAGGAPVNLPLPATKPLERVLEVFCDGLEGRFDRRWGVGLGVRVVEALAACERVLAV